MEGISSTMHKGLKKYWRRKGYQRLNGSWGSQRRKGEDEDLGTCPARRRRWRIKISPKIKIIPRRIPSPKKLLLWLRDAYVGMMVGLANSKMMSLSASSSGYGEKSMGRLDQPKEYNEKMIIQMYKSVMMALGQLVPQDGQLKNGIGNTLHTVKQESIVS